HGPRSHDRRRMREPLERLGRDAASRRQDHEGQAEAKNRPAANTHVDNSIRSAGIIAAPQLPPLHCRKPAPTSDSNGPRGSSRDGLEWGGETYSKRSEEAM